MSKKSKKRKPPTQPTQPQPTQPKQPKQPKQKAKKTYAGIGWMAAVVVAVAVLFVYLGDEVESPPSSRSRRTTTSSIPQQSSPPPARSASSDADVPPFHESADEAKPFPKLRDPARYEIPVVAHAYRIAHEIPEVLAQQPCYCNCGVFGHESLLDCYASDHGAT